MGGHGFDSCRGLIFHIQLPSSKFTIFIYISLLMMNSTVLILAVCRTPVTYELSKMTLLSTSSRSSVDRAPARCSGGHGFDSCRGLRFFFVPRSCHVAAATSGFRSFLLDSYFLSISILTCSILFIVPVAVLK